MSGYGSLALDGDRWVMTDVPPHVAIRLKHLFPRIPKAQTGRFEFPNDWPTAADLAWFTSRYPMAANDDDMQVLDHGRAAFERRQAEIERILTTAYEPPAYVGLREGQTVRPYQGQAVEVLLRSLGLLLGDEVGLGKTYVTAAACLAPGALPAAVVCQTHLQKQWATKIGEFTTLRVHCIKTTKPYTLPPADVYVFRYSQLLGWIDTFETAGFKLVAFDEIQELRTGSASQKGQAAKKLSLKATYRLGLTATPIYNFGSEIWNIMQVINDLVLGSWGDFCREWCTPSGSGWRINDPKALGSYLREQHAFLRRLKHDVGQQMPAINRIVETIDYDRKAVEGAEALARMLAIKATSGAALERGNAVRELDLMMRQVTGVAKAKHVADFARILAEADTPIVLVGWHREVYEIWNSKLRDLRPAMYTGSESPSQKEASVKAFLAGETNIFIMSLRSGAGLDGLQARCSTMIFGELDWSPGVHHQCLGRLDREGQLDPVTGIFLVAEDGSDPPMVDLLSLKASESSQIIDPGLGVQPTHSDGSRLQTLVQRYLTKRQSAPTTPDTEPALTGMEA